MAFDPDGLDIGFATISGGVFRIATYLTDDSEATVQGDGYFQNAATYGLKLNTLIQVFDPEGTNASYTLRVNEINSSGHATAINDPVNNAPITATGSTKARTLEDRFADVPNLLDWDGVDPTGNNDNHSYLVAALAQAQSANRRIVEVPSGYYIIDTAGGTIAWPEGTRMQGTGAWRQTRNPTTAIYGTTIGIVGQVNIAFECARGGQFSRLAFYYPDQIELTAATPTPDAYPYLFKATQGQVHFDHLQLMNVDKFLTSGSMADSQPGAHIFCDTIHACCYRRFAHIENSQAENQFNRCFVATTWSPHIDAVDRAEEVWNVNNLIVFELDGECDALNVNNMQVNRAARFISQLDTAGLATYGINFGQISNSHFDGVPRLYFGDGALAPRSLMFTNVFWAAQNFDDATASLDGCVFDSSKDAGGRPMVMFDGCHISSGQRRLIRVLGTNPVERLIINNCAINDWQVGSAAPALSAAIEFNSPSGDIIVHGSSITKAGGSGGQGTVGVEVVSASKADIASSFDGALTDGAVKVSGAVTQLKTDNTMTGSPKPLVILPAGSVTNWVGHRRPNYIDNPSFDIWQAGTSFAIASATDTFLADRWKCRRQGTGITVSRVAGIRGSEYDLQVQRTAADSSTGIFRLWHQLESDVVRQLAGKTVVLSFHTRGGANLSSTDLSVGWHTGTAGGELVDMSQNDATAFATGGAVTSEVVTIASHRVFLIPFAVPSNALDMALRIQWGPVGTAGAEDLWKIGNVKLELGVEPSAFEQELPATTLIKCQRFYQKSFAQATAPVQNAGAATGEERRAATVAGAVANRFGTVAFPVVMRAAPTVTLYNPAATNAEVRDFTAAADYSSSTANGITERGFLLTATGNASTAVNNAVGVHWTADARL